MLRIQTILAPVDLSRSAQLGVREAASIANKFDAGLLLLHAVEPVQNGDFQGGEAPGLQEAYDAKDLARLVENEAPAASSEVLVVSGDVGECVRRVCEERKVDLIVMPTRGQGSYRQFLLGSNAAKVLHDAPCPVLTGAHIEHPAEACYRYRRVACLLDLKADSRSVLSYAREFAASFDAELTAVHIVPDFRLVAAGLHREFSQTLESSARLRLEKLVAEEKAAAQIVVKAGTYEQVLPALLRDGEFDLLVMSRASGAKSDEVRGVSGEAYAAIRSSPCPVLSI